MSIFQFLFGFQGRIRRLHFWIFYLVLGAVFGGLFWQFGHWHVEHGADGVMLPPHPLPGTWGIYMVSHNPLFGLVGLAAIWMKLAVDIKRWHDRDKSGWWVLITLVPVIGGLWQLIECGFLDGTQGPNRYGPSPKGL